MKTTAQAFANRIQNEDATLVIEMLSDLHIGFTQNTKSLTAALESIWKRKVRHVFIAGDLTANGYFWQQNKVFQALEEFPIHYAIALGNHDTYRGKHVHDIRVHPHYRKQYSKHSTQLYYDLSLPSVHVYVINSEQPCKDGIFLSTKQKHWLLRGLQKEAPETLSIILAHHPLQDTHPHSDDPHTSLSLAQLHPTELHTAHERILYISGHTHIDYSQSVPIYKNGIYFLNLPSFVKPDQKKGEGKKGIQLQVYPDFLYVRTRDYQQDEWITSHEYILDLTKSQILPFDANPLNNTKMSSS